MYISIDLDDTLLRNDKSISDYTYEVLKKVQQLGHFIIINTARNYERTKEYIELIKPDFTVVNAGAMIYDVSKNLVYKSLISIEKTNKLVQRIFPFCEYMNIQTIDNLFSTKPQTKELNDIFHFVNYNTKNKFLFETAKVLPYKIDLNMAKTIALEMNLEFASYFGGAWSRFTESGVTKLSGLKWIVTNTGGSMKDTISFGDDHGDVDMLLGSEIGVAMANSQKEVLEVVKEVTDDCNDDGVANYLVKLFKIN